MVGQASADACRSSSVEILEEIASTGAVRVSELVHLFGISDMTVRRDLAVLARDGLIAKVHGGASDRD